MRLTIELTTDEAIAFRRFANAHYPLPLEEAAALALREYLISTGDLEVVPSIDEDSQVEGTA
ncbi:hypothetical protein ATER59S_02370 [Aquamicrobium terrae]